MRRRATIAEDRAAVAAELDKISAMEAQISLALEEIGAKDRRPSTRSRSGRRPQLAIAKLEAARSQVETKVSPQLLDVYNRTAARSGVANRRCSTATAAAPAARSSTAAVSSICATRHRWVCAPRASVCW